jgi:xanthine dehydrogenase accessory factor
MSDATTKEILSEIVRAEEGGPPVLVATLIAGPPGAPLGAKLLVREDGSTLGSLGSPPLDAAIADLFGDRQITRAVRTCYIQPDGTMVTRATAGEETAQVMTEVHERPARLVIAGGGHVGKALSAIAAMCGFRVTIVDDRAEYADPERFPEADEVIRGRFDEVLGGYAIDGSTYVVAVTRGHRHDEVSLRAVVGRGAAYVGMIGSRRRARAVLEHLVEDGADPEAVAGIHTPIGLDIGAETPEEIAVSIMAEIIEVRRRGHSSNKEKANLP